MAQDSPSIPPPPAPWEPPYAIIPPPPRVGQPSAPRQYWEEPHFLAWSSRMAQERARMSLEERARASKRKPRWPYWLLGGLGFVLYVLATGVGGLAALLLVSFGVVAVVLFYGIATTGPPPGVDMRMNDPLWVLYDQRTGEVIRDNPYARRDRYGRLYNSRGTDSDGSGMS